MWSFYAIHSFQLLQFDTEYYKKWDDFMCMNIDSVLDDIMSLASLSLLGPDFCKRVHIKIF